VTARRDRSRSEVSFIVELVSTAHHVDELRVLVSDGRWWERPNCFGHPQAQQFVPDLDAAISELRNLFPAEVCIDLVQRGHGARMIGLFLGDGWYDGVDELLQLGSDLSHCAGWCDDHKLVADLRRVEFYEAARLEVGIWAGLRRVGLAPEREPANNRAAKRADFRVVDGTHRVAMELKSLADPQRARNAELLFSYLWRAAVTLWSETVGSIELEPSADLDALMYGTAEVFRRELDARIWPAIAARLRQHIDLGRHEIDGIGVIVVGPRDPTWGWNLAGRTGINNEDEWTVKNAARRVLRCVVSARHQLIATETDLRAAVVWGGFDHSPCRAVADEVAHQIRAGFDVGAVDYIGILNSHRRGPRPGWTTEAEVLRVCDGCPLPEAMTWPRALIAWNLLHRAG
jgi:hypothetical protein